MLQYSVCTFGTSRTSHEWSWQYQEAYCPPHLWLNQSNIFKPFIFFPVSCCRYCARFVSWWQSCATCMMWRCHVRLARLMRRSLPRYCTATPSQPHWEMGKKLRALGWVISDANLCYWHANLRLLCAWIYLNFCIETERHSKNWK